MDYQQFYDFVVQESARLKEKDVANDYQLCKALAACYELREYLANRIAELVEHGHQRHHRLCGKPGKDG